MTEETPEGISVPLTCAYSSSINISSTRSGGSCSSIQIASTYRFHSRAPARARMYSSSINISSGGGGSSIQIASTYRFHSRAPAREAPPESSRASAPTRGPSRAPPSCGGAAAASAWKANTCQRERAAWRGASFGRATPCRPARLRRARRPTSGRSSSIALGQRCRGCQHE